MHVLRLPTSYVFVSYAGFAFSTREFCKPNTSDSTRRRCDDSACKRATGSPRRPHAATRTRACMNVVKRVRMMRMRRIVLTRVVSQNRRRDRGGRKEDRAAATPATASLIDNGDGFVSRSESVVARRGSCSSRRRRQRRGQLARCTRRRTRGCKSAPRVSDDEGWGREDVWRRSAKRQLTRDEKDESDGRHF